MLNPHDRLAAFDLETGGLDPLRHQGKPFSGPNTPGFSHCWDCGFTWEAGKDGSHSCVEVLQRLLSHTYIIPHRGDPCILCRKPMEEFEPGGCTITIQQLYSRIGDLVDEATTLEESGQLVEARGKTEESKRLRLLHQVLSRDLAPVSAATPKPEGA